MHRPGGGWQVYKILITMGYIWINKRDGIQFYAATLTKAKVTDGSAGSEYLGLSKPVIIGEYAQIFAINNTGDHVMLDILGDTDIVHIGMFSDKVQDDILSTLQEEYDKLWEVMGTN